MDAHVSLFEGLLFNPLRIFIINYLTKYLIACWLKLVCLAGNMKTRWSKLVMLNSQTLEEKWRKKSCSASQGTEMLAGGFGGICRSAGGLQTMLKRPPDLFTNSPQHELGSARRQKRTIVSASQVFTFSLVHLHRATSTSKPSIFWERQSVTRLHSNFDYHRHSE